MLTFAGLRFGELASLGVKHVDLPRRHLLVAYSVTEVGGRPTWSTAKIHQTRSVLFPQSLASFNEQPIDSRGPVDLLFTAPGGEVLRLRNWRRRVFDPRYSATTTRRRYAS